MSVVGARWRGLASEVHVGPIGVASRDGEVVAAQFGMGVLAIGPRFTAMAEQESASHTAARAIGSAAPMGPLGRGGGCAGVDTETKMAESAQWIRSCAMTMPSTKKPSVPIRLYGPLLTSSTGSPQQTASASPRDHLEQHGKTRMRREGALGAATGATLREENQASAGANVPSCSVVGAIPVVATIVLIQTVNAVDARSPGIVRCDVATAARAAATVFKPSYPRRRCDRPPTA